MKLYTLEDLFELLIKESTKKSQIGNLLPEIPGILEMSGIWLEL
ncbi:hypothetical protein CKA32_001275 [Geitlerinema sp. FC II]|nr:hypothetical protein CKA32_001275 [Geitlerinema sp. FC II]